MLELSRLSLGKHQHVIICREELIIRARNKLSFATNGPTFDYFTKVTFWLYVYFLYVIHFMTYREVRQFAEIVRTLGCPIPVGLDSFDTPNFGLMAQLLQWLSGLYDPDIVIIPELSNEHGRVEFVKGIVQQMAIRSGIRLNPRKLYASDRFAVRELLKVAAPIYRGITSSDIPGDKAGTRTKAPSAAKISQLSATVPKHAVELYDQLEKELMIRETRTKILSTMPPLDEVEKNVVAAVDGASTRLETLTKELDKLNSDEDTLRSKIKQRKHELERQSKRLMSVITIRPAFMDEYEALEQELQELFKIHFQHYRNVDFYEHELQKQNEKRRKFIEAQEKKNKKEQAKAKERIAETLKESFNTPNMHGDTLSSGDDLGLGGGADDDTDNSF